MSEETDEGIGPAVRRRQLGRQLRELRVAAGLTTIRAGAEVSGFSAASLSRIETAKQAILPRTVMAICQAYGVGAPVLDHLLRLARESEERGWLVAYSDTTPAWLERYVGEEGDAAEIWAYELTLIPGLLQTEAYCRAVAESWGPSITDAEVERRVALRRARQERLARTPQPTLVAIVGMAALLQEVGGPDVMREQREQLAALAERDNIELRVLPFSTGAHPGMVSAFTMLHFPADIGDPTIFVEVDSGALYPDRPVDFARYTWIFERLRELALPPAESRALASRLDAGEYLGDRKDPS